MTSVKNWEIHLGHESKAVNEFRTAVHQADQMLQADNIVFLKYPIDIYEECHKAAWYYKSIRPCDDDDEDEEDEKSYIFNNITIGLYVTKQNEIGEEYVKPYLTIFIGNYNADPIINLNRYILSDSINMVKITQDLAKVPATIHKLETLIDNMKPDQHEIAMRLLIFIFND